MMRAILVAAGLLFAGCRHSGGTKDATLGSDARPSEAGGTIDSRDSSPPDSSPPAKCASLYGFDQKATILPESAARGWFSPDGTRVALVECKYPAPCNLVVVNLKSLAVVMIAANVLDAQWLGSDVILATTSPASPNEGPWLPRPWPYSLEEHDLVSARSRVLMSDLCDHRISEDGKTLYVVTACQAAAPATLPWSPAWTGALGLMERTTGTTQTIATGVHATSLAITRDGERAAFVTKPKPGLTECDTGYNDGGTGTLREFVRPAGITTTLGTDVVAFSVHYTASNRRLLWQVSATPVWSGPGMLMTKLSDGPTTALGAYHFAFQCLGSTYHLSPDEKLIVGSDTSATTQGLTMYAVSTDGSGKTAIASDLYNPFGEDHAWAKSGLGGFSPSGKYLAYVTASKTIKALTVPSWKAVATEILSRNWAPNEDAVAFFDRSTPAWLKVVPLDTSADARLVQLGPGELPNQLTFLPDGRGLVYTEFHSSATAQIRYVSRATRQPVVLGPFRSPTTYQLDPLGCSVLWGDWSGTLIARLPR